MNPEQQVVSLELAKKLKELGVKQESLFWWNLWRGQMDDFMYQIHYGKPVVRGDGVLSEETYSAFTVAELGEMLPWRSKRMETLNNAELVSTKLVNIATRQTIWTVAYWDEDKDLYGGMVIRFTADTEADARAKMLIYLLENKLI